MAYGPPLNASNYEDDARWRREQGNSGPIRAEYPQMTQADVQREAQAMEFRRRADERLARDRIVRDRIERERMERDRLLSYQYQAMQAALGVPTRFNERTEQMPFGVAAAAGLAGIGSSLGQMMGQPGALIPVPGDVYPINRDYLMRNAPTGFIYALKQQEMATQAEPEPDPLPKRRELDLDDAPEIKAPVIVARAIEL